LNVNIVALTVTIGAPNVESVVQKCHVCGANVKFAALNFDYAALDVNIVPLKMSSVGR
jgi:hypothetical protein